MKKRFSHSQLFRAQTGTRAGFTLIELLTVIAIIGILAAILIPVVGRVRESANQAKCASNVRQLVQACHIYAEEHGVFPAIEANYESPLPPQMNWIMLLENLGYTDKLASIHTNIDTLWICPSAAKARTPKAGNANTYGRNDQTGRWFTQRRPADSPDRAPAPTRTAMIMDGNWVPGAEVYRTWVSPNDFPDFVHPPSAVGSTDASARINVAFVDGHVESRRRGDGTGENDVPRVASDVFWSGIE